MKMKGVLSLLLALVMCLAMAAPAFAYEPGDGGNSGISPHLDYVPFKQPITPTSSDATWDQPENYKGYHVWVENTSTGHMSRRGWPRTAIGSCSRPPTRRPEGIESVSMWRTATKRAPSASV